MGILSKIILWPILLKMSMMAVMVGADAIMSSVKFSVTLRSWSTNPGSELLFRSCEG